MNVHRLRQKKINCWIKLLFFFSLHTNKYFHSFLPLLLTHLCLMDYFNDALTMFLCLERCSCVFLYVQGPKALRFIQKYLHLYLNLFWLWMKVLWVWNDISVSHFWGNYPFKNINVARKDMAKWPKASVWRVYRGQQFKKKHRQILLHPFLFHPSEVLLPGWVISKVVNKRTQMLTVCMHLSSDCIIK